MGSSGTETAMSSCDGVYSLFATPYPWLLTPREKLALRISRQSHRGSSGSSTLPLKGLEESANIQCSRYVRHLPQTLLPSCMFGTTSPGKYDWSESLSMETLALTLDRHVRSDNGQGYWSNSTCVHTMNNTNHFVTSQGYGLPTSRGRRVSK